MTKNVLVSLELNEINFEFVAEYVRRGYLPTFAQLLKTHKLFKTRAERNYKELEPWIQWPTVYSGKTYAEHGIFRLGDVNRTQHDQIWETLEKKNLTVGAISPINAANRCERAAFFVPDPWTETRVTADRHVHKLYQSIRDIVNENTTGRAKKSSLFWFAVLSLPYLTARSLPDYWRMIKLRLQGQRWALALVLDRLLADIFIRLWSSTKPDFASLFLNAGAHVQHHHLFESACYGGKSRNPDWYSSANGKGIDPVLTTYQMYDQILADFLRLKNVRLLLSTGLSQVANERPIFQYRFRNHGEFMSRLGLRGFAVVPRMSRDFSVRVEDAAAVESMTAALTTLHIDGNPLISVDVRDSGDLFCKISYHGDPSGLRRVQNGAAVIDMTDDVALVSIENGIHSTIGYHLDTAVPATAEQDEGPMPLPRLFDKIVRIASDSPMRPAAAARDDKIDLYEDELSGQGAS
jgi:hypothetical protein